jgi:hypothetical protein
MLFLYIYNVLCKRIYAFVIETIIFTLYRREETVAFTKWNSTGMT